jgi:uncharacterized protein (DUF2141 family)
MPTLSLILLLLNPLVLFTPSYQLTVTITSLHSNDGAVYVSLYNSEAGYPKDPNKALRKALVKISNRTAVVTFDSLPPGVYAVACYHDEDGNGKLNTNFLGIPTEGVGASNDAKGFMGPPSFKDASFSLRANAAIVIHMKY